MLGHEAEEDRRGQVLGAQGARGQGGEEVEGGGFAAFGFRRGEVEARGVKKGLESMGMNGPKRDGVGRAGGKDHLKGESRGDLVQHFRAIDRVRPRLDERQFDAASLDVGSAPGDLAVEGFHPGSQPLGGVLAGAVVLGG